ncbi:MAG TPA: anion transporter [Anaerolineae bacterium]|nr:anion transporter [Anaerolineae bacterium]
MPVSFWVACAVIPLTLVGVAVGRYPGLRMNRATIALAGAVVLIVAGSISLEEAYAALDMDTLALLFAMMVLNVNLRGSGFFKLVGRWVIRWARSPRQLLALVVVTAGLLSALFLNDTIVLMFTPLVLEIVLALGRNPIPYLVGLVSAANIGSAATITGNPQNMLIGASSRIPYVRFTAALAPVALAGMAVAWGVLVLVYRKEFVRGRLEEIPEQRMRLLRPLLYKSLLATTGMLIALLAGAPIALSALAAAAALLITRRVKPQRIFREVDFSLLVFFAGLFIVTGTIESTGLSDLLFRMARPVAEGGVAPLAGVSVVLSNLVSNVPAVMLFRPLIPQLADPQKAWLTLAMATTFAGNLTLLGSVANLIVAESARERGVKLSFGEYLKAGVPITVVSLALGVVWLITV